jgi:hypothetical protein
MDYQRPQLKELGSLTELTQHNGGSYLNGGGIDMPHQQQHDLLWQLLQFWRSHLHWR